MSRLHPECQCCRNARANPGNSTDSTAPSYDMKAQALLDLQAVNKKCVDLAEALPGDKLTWRPPRTHGPLLKCFCMLRESATESSA